MKDGERDCLARPTRPTRSGRAAQCQTTGANAAALTSAYPRQAPAHYSPGSLDLHSNPHPPTCLLAPSIVNTREGRTSPRSIPAEGGSEGVENSGFATELPRGRDSYGWEEGTPRTPSKGAECKLQTGPPPREASNEDSLKNLPRFRSPSACSLHLDGRTFSRLVIGGSADRSIMTSPASLPPGG